MARAMVTRYGLSEALGPLAYGENEEEVFLGHSVTRTQNISPETAKLIDQEIRRIVDECYARAENILKEHLDDLHTLANGLLEYETLSGDEIKGLLRGEPIIRHDPDDDKDAKPPRSSVPSGGSVVGDTKPA